MSAARAITKALREQQAVDTAALIYECAYGFAPPTNLSRRELMIAVAAACEAVDHPWEVDGPSAQVVRREANELAGHRWG